MQSKQRATVSARPSATIVMLRDAQPAPELLMVRRRGGDAFGESYAFPGGVLDDDESLAAGFCHGRTPKEADAMLGVSGGGLDFYVAAIRELFEETGILLVRDESGAWASTVEDLETLRARLCGRTLQWSQFLRQHTLTMACDALHYFAHWETPLGLPKRWSTRFFLALMPPGQDARHDGAELTDSRWLRAAEAMTHAKHGSMKVPFPTYRNLEALSAFESIDALDGWAARRRAEGIPKTRPMEVDSRWVIPGDPGYPEGGDGEE